LFALSPVARAVDADFIVAKRKTHRQYSIPNLPETEKTLLDAAVRNVFRDHTALVRERQLRLRE